MPIEDRLDEQASSKRVVAAFDFDGTIIRGDSLLPFLLRACGTKIVITTLLIESPKLLRSRVHRAYRDTAKAAVISRTLKGRKHSELDEIGTQYAAELSARRTRLHVLQRVEWHRRQNHELLLLSASITAYVTPFAKMHGFANAISTQLGMDAEGRVTGAFLGDNVRGKSKVRALANWLAGDSAELWAYGDSTDDVHLFKTADHAFVVNRHGIKPWTA